MIRSLDHFVHATRVSPWRLQRQWIGNFLLAVVASAMIAALYLDVAAQAAIAGREIQDLDAALTSGQRAIADLETQLAAGTSADLMQERAEALGFVPTQPDEPEYLIVPGYTKPEPRILASSDVPAFSPPSIPPEYTQSLLSWIQQAVEELASRGQRR